MRIREWGRVDYEDSIELSSFLWSISCGKLLKHLDGYSPGADMHVYSRERETREWLSVHVRYISEGLDPQFSCHALPASFD